MIARKYETRLKLGFRMGGSSVMDGGKYTVNINPASAVEYLD